jgi:hypothetical protein
MWARSVEQARATGRALPSPTYGSNSTMPVLERCDRIVVGRRAHSSDRQDLSVPKPLKQKAGVAGSKIES